MPNHVTNILRINGKKQEVEKCLSQIKGDDTTTYIDFNKIVPMPKNIIRGDLDEKTRKDNHDKNWYDWSITNWGTKWNAYESSKSEDNVIIFRTAWSTPIPIFIELSKQCPNLMFEIWYADEDVGNNCGSFSMINSKMHDEYLPNYSEESCEFASNIQDGYIDDNFKTIVRKTRHLNK